MLRVGIMLDSFTSSAWVARVIDDIQSSGFARVDLVTLDDNFRQRKSSPKMRLRDWDLALFRIYERWDYSRNKAGHDALARTDLSSRLNGIPFISLVPDRKNGITRIPERHSADIRNYELDVIFHFGFGVVTGEIRCAARYGVWSFHHGGDYEDQSTAPLFRELAEGIPVSGSRLLILSDSGDTRVAYQSYASTDQISLYGNRNPIYWKTAEFALRRLRDLHAGGLEYIQSLPTYREPEGGRRRKWTPSNLQMILFARRYLSGWLEARGAPPPSQSGVRMKWHIGIRRRNASYAFDDSSNYQLLPCPQDRFYADPFLFEKDGKTFLFFEDFRYEEGRAVISCCELGSNGTPGESFEVLRCPFHLSYPFVFEDEEGVYMIPETRGNRMVELYRATNFPTTWAAEAVLFRDVHVVDATIHKVNEKFWMFAGVSNGLYSNSDELCLFFADALKGPWMPHRNNPLISDVRRARPAGRLFYDEGRLIRPSQDCGKAYGYALAFSEVLALSETEYEERQISRLEPGVVTGCIGTHTYNRTEQFEVVDRTLMRQ